MRAAIYETFGQPISVRELPDPTPSPCGVVVQVRASGLCRSDWLGWMGHDADVRVPHVPGHEFAGMVVEVGAEVGRWQPGTRVTVPFVGGCGRCGQCLAGHPQVCDDQFQPGFTHWGSFAERVAVDRADVNLVELPPWLDFVSAASLGCRFVTAYRAVVEQGRPRPGDWVAIHGCGGVGTSAIAIARAVGAQVAAVDLDPERLKLARLLGATVSIEAGKGEVALRLRDLTGGGAQVSIDAMGSAQTCYESIMCLRKRGRHVQVGVMAGDARNAPVPMDRVMAQELEIVGSHGVAAHRYPQIFDLVRAGGIDLSRLIGRTIGLDEVPAEMERLERFYGVGMVVIDRF